MSILYNSVIIVSTFLFLGCSSNGKTEEANENTDDYQYVPLTDYKIDSVQINEGDNLRIIGYSGGKNTDNDNVYFHVFLVINKISEDTLRVLAPLINVDQGSGPEGSTYTSPTSFDGSKGIFESSYMPLDSARSVWINFLSASSSNSGRLDSVSNILSNQITAKQWVVVNKSIPMLQDSQYKAIMGILKFDQIPW